MNRQELHDLLIATNIAPQTFDVLGVDRDPMPGDVFLLRFIKSWIDGKPDYWATYYSERGNWFQIKRFQSEDEACRYFLDWVGQRSMNNR